MDNPKKVVILVNELLRGGAQRIILDIAKNIDRSKVALTILRMKSYANFPKQQTLEEDAAKLGVRVVSLEGGKRASLGEAVRLYRFLKEERPDIVHTFLPYAGIMGRVLGRLAGIRTLVSTQCNLPVAYTRTTYWLDRLTLPLAHAWTAATESIEVSYGATYRYFGEDRWKQGRRHFTIVAGVDLPAFDARVTHTNRVSKRAELGIHTDGIFIVMIARLVSWKGHTALIEALPKLPPATHLGFVGWGPLEQTLRDDAKRLGCDARVHFLGARSDVPEVLAAADFYAQTHGYAPDGKIWEGPNTSQMEACAAHLPSMSTAVPRIETLIEDGITGVLARPDDAADIARALRFLMDHPDESKRMSEAARERVEQRYSVATMTHAYEELYACVSGLPRA